MELAITNVPAWLSILFGVTFSISIFLIANTLKAVYIDGEKSIEEAQRVYKKTFLFYGLFLGLVSLASLKGFFLENRLPPTIVVTVTLPLLLFYLLYIQKTNWFRWVFQKITIDQIVRIHLFRFIGVFFFLTYYYKALPKEFAFIGGGGDILTAVLAIPLIYGIRQKRKGIKTAVYIWNTIGLIDIFSVLTTAILVTKDAVQNNSEGVSQFGTFPFSWIPAFAPATIIFLHVLVFRKLK